jgi:hypothetical protein
MLAISQALMLRQMPKLTEPQQPARTCTILWKSAIFLYTWQTSCAAQYATSDVTPILLYCRKKMKHATMSEQNPAILTPTSAGFSAVKDVMLSC